MTGVLGRWRQVEADSIGSYLRFQVVLCCWFLFFKIPMFLVCSFFGFARRMWKALGICRVMTHLTHGPFLRSSPGDTRPRIVRSISQTFWGDEDARAFLFQMDLFPQNIYVFGKEQALFGRVYGSSLSLVSHVPSDLLLPLEAPAPEPAEPEPAAEPAQPAADGETLGQCNKREVTCGGVLHLPKFCGIFVAYELITRRYVFCIRKYVMIKRYSFRSLQHWRTDAGPAEVSGASKQRRGAGGRRFWWEREASFFLCGWGGVWGIVFGMFKGLWRFGCVLAFHL